MFVWILTLMVLLSGIYVSFTVIIKVILSISIFHFVCLSIIVAVDGLFFPVEIKSRAILTKRNRCQMLA